MLLVLLLLLDQTSRGVPGIREEKKPLPLGTSSTTAARTEESPSQTEIQEKRNKKGKTDHDGGRDLLKKDNDKRLTRDCSGSRLTAESSGVSSSTLPTAEKNKKTGKDLTCI